MLLLWSLLLFLQERGGAHALGRGALLRALKHNWHFFTEARQELVEQVGFKASVSALKRYWAKARPADTGVGEVKPATQPKNPKKDKVVRKSGSSDGTAPNCITMGATSFLRP